MRRALCLWLVLLLAIASPSDFGAAGFAVARFAAAFFAGARRRRGAGGSDDTTRKLGEAIQTHRPSCIVMHLQVLPLFL